MIHRNLQIRMSAANIAHADILNEMHRRGYDVAACTVSAWISGHRTPRLEHARALADILGCTLDELTEDVAA